MQTKIPKEAIKKYLKEKFKAPVKLPEYKNLGKGWQGSSYKLTFKVKNKIHTLILRIKNKLDFSHDYKSDRASSAILNHQMDNITPKHVRSLDVVGITKNKNIVSLWDCDEFFQLVEIVKGTEYMKDLQKIKKTGRKYKNLGKVIGIDVPFEESKKAEIIINSSVIKPKKAANIIFNYLKKNNLI
jgi:hypothetical protein|tara:strand:- start:7252 stop:7806 length:555 start_codon:yes stop_codon:yes gene_type:complete